MSTGWHFVVVVMALSASVLVLRTKAIATEDPSAEASVASATDASPASETRTPSKYRLTFKFQPNQIVRYEVSQESTITTHVKDDTETAKNSSQAKRQHFKVIAVDEKTGDADLELSIDWVHMLASFNNPARQDRSDRVPERRSSETSPAIFRHSEHGGQAAGDDPVQPGG